MNKELLLKYIFESKDLKWLDSINDIDCIKLQQMLILNEEISLRIRWLDKFIFKCSTKQFLSLLWSCIPKDLNYKNINYNINKNTEFNKFDFILNKIKEYYNFSDYEFNYHKNRLIKLIDENKEEWFKFFAVEKHHWEYYRIDYKKFSLL